MALKKIYYCDICGDEIKDKSNCFGLNFIDLKAFRLGTFSCTENKHICYNCAIQLKECLNDKEIANRLAQKEA